MRTSVARRTGASAGVIALALVASGCGGGGYKTQTLTFSERETDNNGFVSHVGPLTVKFGPQGPGTLSAGDILAFSSDFVDSSKKKVGEINGTCSVTRPGPFEKATATCTATASVPGGSLILARVVPRSRRGRSPEPSSAVPASTREQAAPSSFVRRVTTRPWSTRSTSRSRRSSASHAG